jgi:hypothetical protein
MPEAADAEGRREPPRDRRAVPAVLRGVRSGDQRRHRPSHCSRDRQARARPQAHMAMVDLLAIGAHLTIRREAAISSAGGGRWIREARGAAWHVRRRAAAVALCPDCAHPRQRRRSCARKSARSRCWRKGREDRSGREMSWTGRQMRVRSSEVTKRSILERTAHSRRARQGRPHRSGKSRAFRCSTRRCRQPIPRRSRRDRPTICRARSK